jgi:hypothetical protein
MLTLELLQPASSTSAVLQQSHACTFMLPRATPMAQPHAPIASSSVQGRHRDVRHLRHQHVEA